MTEVADAVDGPPPAAAAAGEGEPQGFLARVTGGSPFTPLGVLFGLNIADELDRSAFAVLLPDIRDHFGLDNSGILGLVALATAAALLLTVPIATWADRGNRVHIALLGAAAWGAFSLGTGLAPVVWVLVAVRCGSAIGNAAIFPTHNSLLSDYY
ncbi:MAG TPA: MFS transporter, partial [Iamia sp.]|nr:MFS transporter [Iamia sp.]